MTLAPNDVDPLHRRASAMVRQGRYAEAEPLYRRLFGETQALDEDFHSWLRESVALYGGLGRMREAGHVLTYLGRYSDAHAAFVADGAHVEAARCRDLWAQRAAADPVARPVAGPIARAGATAGAAAHGGPNSPATDPLFVAAAGEYVVCGLVAHAAIAYSAGGAFAEACRSWEKVLAHPRLAGRPYEQALCHFDIGVALRREGLREPAARHFSRAQRLLEEVADEFESRGERERAFDCYAVLIQLGREEGAFENLAEGYVNCIRILKEDSLKYYVLQYYEDFLRVALERAEFYAAATVAREAADYARRLGLACDHHYLRRGGEIWLRAGEHNDQKGGPVELTESALLSSVDCYGMLGDYGLVRRSYERLASLPLAERKRERYRQIAARYSEAPERSSSASSPSDDRGISDYLMQRHVYPPIWELDLVEWELDGDPIAVCASILGDPHFPNMIRRPALSTVLAHLDGLRTGHPLAEDPRRLAQMTEGLGSLKAYAALRPLEKLYGHESAEVRRAVMRALGLLYFKRTFLLLDRGLRDIAPEVRDAALESLEELRFPHAFDPLVRIFRSHSEYAVQATALGAIGRIATVEAGEFLIQILRQESGGLRELARRLLGNFENAEIVPILKRHLEAERGPARADLEKILARSRG